MAFPKRKRSSPSSTNPFGRKLSPEDAAARDAPRSVQQSLFSAIRAVGYEGSAASSIAWRLIKAARPRMVDCASSREQVEGCDLAELTELRACAVLSAGRESMSNEPARAELIGDVIAMLDGCIARAASSASLSASPLSGVAARAPAPAADLEDAEFQLRCDRLSELTHGGMAAEQASLIVMSEAKEREKAATP